MNRLFTLATLLSLLLLVGCPSSSDTAEDPAADIDTRVESLPTRVYVRQHAGSSDIEPVIWQKDFAGLLSTEFAETVSGVNIDVETTAAADCPPGNTACETWLISSATSRPGEFAIDAFRDIIQPDGDLDTASGDVAVYVLPDNSGSERVRVISPENVQTVVDDAGALWSVEEDALFAFLGQPEGQNYDSVFAQAADDVAISPVADIAFAISGWFALGTDGRVFGQQDFSSRPTAFSMLNNLLAQIESNNGARVSAIFADGFSFDSSRGTTPESLSALLLDDGRVVVWYRSDEGSNIDLFSTAPTVIDDIDRVVDIGIETHYVLFLRDDGTVWELGRTSAGGVEPANIVGTPTQVSGLSGITELAGRKALGSNGQVFVVPETQVAGETTTPVVVPGLSDAVSLLDSIHDVAERADGSLAYWQYDVISEAPQLPVEVSLTPLGQPAAIARSYASDMVCGRLWELRDAPWERSQALAPGGSATIQAYPRIGFGGNARCENGNMSRVVFFVLNGNGSGTISSSTGTIECFDDPLINNYCWWFGANDTQPRFSAIPDSGSVFRDWRWDCASSDPLSAPVQQLPDSSQNLCKVTFVLGEDDAPPMIEERRLEVRANGVGRVDVSPEPNRVDAVGAFYDDGTDVTLTAVPGDGFVFGSWDQNGCTNDLDSDVITVTMDADRLCVVNFVQPATGVPPVGRISVTPSTVVDPGTTVTLDASASSDADGTIVSWDWDFNGDAIIDASGETVMTSFTTPGINDVLLTVTDNDALEGQAAVGITVRAATGGQTFSVRVVVTGDGQVSVAPLDRTLRDAACDGDECFLNEIAAGTELTLTASPFTPAAFAGWDSAECDSIPTADVCIITVNSQRSVTALFQ
ncbi:MAG: PKD domain-containing protein [Pseudomonadota bacterium]